MHQAYFDRKLSQPSTTSTSRSLTPKPFTRMQEDPTKSPERIDSEFGLSNHSPTVSAQKVMTSSSNSLSGSTAKVSGKVREQLLSTDRLRNRNPNVYCYNASNKSTNNINSDLMRSKTKSNNCVITKTEPSGDLENNYTSQINKLLQKINKLKYDLSQSQERESQYLSKLSNLESENKSLQRIIEDKDKRLQEITQKSKEDKLRMYQFLTELETYKQSNKDCRDDTSMIKLSDLCDSTRNKEKGPLVEKGIQTIEGADSPPCCPRCESVNNYCELLQSKLSEVDQASRYLLKENNTMKESLMKARRAENEYVRARSEIEKKAVEIQNDFDKQAETYNEVIAENYAIRTTLKEAMSYDPLKPQGYFENKKPLQTKMNKENYQQQMYPLPASLRALIGAEKISKATN